MMLLRRDPPPDFLAGLWKTLRGLPAFHAWSKSLPRRGLLLILRNSRLLPDRLPFCRRLREESNNNDGTTKRRYDEIQNFIYLSQKVAKILYFVVSSFRRSGR